MGKYVERTSHSRLDAKFTQKLSQLILDGADVLEKEPVEWTEDLICLVDNGPFAAAAYCYDETEFKRFIYSFEHGDDRPHIWLIYPKVKEFVK